MRIAVLGAGGVGGYFGGRLAAQRQCQLANGLIEFRYGNASGQIFPGNGQ